MQHPSEAQQNTHRPGADLDPSNPTVIFYSAGWFPAHIQLEGVDGEALAAFERALADDAMDNGARFTPQMLPHYNGLKDKAKEVYERKQRLEDQQRRVAEAAARATASRRQPPRRRGGQQRRALRAIRAPRTAAAAMSATGPPSSGDEPPGKGGDDPPSPGDDDEAESASGPDGGRATQATPHVAHLPKQKKGGARVRRRESAPSASLAGLGDEPAGDPVGVPPARGSEGHTAAGDDWAVATTFVTDDRAITEKCETALVEALRALWIRHGAK